jgi:deoxyribodipyrimidine photo-lyase
VKHPDPLLQNRNNHDLVNVSPDRFQGMCRIMGDFRKAARKSASVRNVLEPPKRLVKPPNFDSLGTRTVIEPGSIPTLEELFQVFLLKPKDTVLGIDRDTIDFVFKSARDKRRLGLDLRSDCDSQNNGCGEAAALRRLEVFLVEGHAARADRSLADVSKNNSSRLSIHFAVGTLSPRMVYWRAHEAGEGAEWLMSHLEMRDFFLYTCFAAGDGFYQRKGLPVSKKQEDIQWYSPKDKDKQEQWKRWATGKTHLPLVDAAMIELMTTGYCSNRVRQNVASVLTKDLGIDWRAGAEWFQFLLEDHCVGANFGNWMYFSGVGPDPKNRHFRTVSQAKRYDRDGDFVKKWLPDLNLCNDEEVAFRPWDFGIVGYESPVVDPETQYTWQDLQYLKENGSFLLQCKELE